MERKAGEKSAVTSDAMSEGYSVLERKKPVDTKRIVV